MRVPPPSETSGCLNVLLPATVTEPEQHLRFILLKPGVSRTTQFSEKSQKPAAQDSQDSDSDQDF